MTPIQRVWAQNILVLVGFVALFFALKSLYFVIIPFAVGFIGAYICQGCISWATQFKFISRGLASAITVAALFCMFFGLIIVALPYIQTQLIKLGTAIPHLVSDILTLSEPILESLLKRSPLQLVPLQTALEQHLGDIMSLGLQILTNLISNTMVIANILSWIVLTPFAMFYFLKDWPAILSTLGNLIPPRHRVATHRILKEIDQRLTAFGHGQSLACIILGILYASGLTAIGLGQGIFLGFVIGVLAFIPYVGAFIGFLACIGLSLAQLGDWSLVGRICAVFAIIGVIEGYLLTPRLVGQKIGLHPLWILFALLAGGTWFGFAGLVLTLPIAAVIAVAVRTLCVSYQKSLLYQGHG